MTVRLNITIDEDLVHKIKNFAKKHNRSVSQIVEDQLKSILSRHSEKKTSFSKKAAGIIKNTKFNNLNKIRDAYLKEDYDL